MFFLLGTHTYTSTICSYTMFLHTSGVDTYLRNWDLAVPGSPHSSTLMSPRTLCFPPEQSLYQSQWEVTRTQLLWLQADSPTWIFGLASKQRQGEGSLDVLVTIDGRRHAGEDLQTRQKAGQTDHYGKLPINHFNSIIQLTDQD